MVRFIIWLLDYLLYLLDIYEIFWFVGDRLLLFLYTYRRSEEVSYYTTVVKKPKVSLV